MKWMLSPLLVSALWMSPLLVFLTTNSPSTQNQTLTVIIKNIKNNKGNIGMALYTSDRDFMKNIWRSSSTKAKTGEVQLTFEDLPPELTLSV